MDILRPTDLLDLPWPARCRATLDLFELRQFQASKAGKPRPTVKDLTLEIRESDSGSAQSATRVDLLLAPHLDDIEVARCASAAEAFQVLKLREAQKKEAVK